MTQKAYRMEKIILNHQFSLLKNTYKNLYNNLSMSLYYLKHFLT